MCSMSNLNARIRSYKTPWQCTSAVKKNSNDFDQATAKTIGRSGDSKKRLSASSNLLCRFSIVASYICCSSLLHCITTSIGGYRQGIMMIRFEDGYLA